MSSATLTATTTPIVGPSAVGWKRTQPPALPNWWSYERSSRKSRYRFTWRPRYRRRPSHSFSPTCPTPTARLWGSSGMVGRGQGCRRRQRAGPGRPPAVGGGGGPAGTGGGQNAAAVALRTFRGRPLQSPRCPAQVPSHAQRRRTGGGAGVSLGEVDHLPPSGPAWFGGAELQWPRQGFRLRRHRQDRRSAASGGILAKSNRGSRVLLTTFSDALANLRKAKLQLLVPKDTQTESKISVESLDAVALELYKAELGPVKLAPQETIKALVNEAAEATRTNSPRPFF